MLENVGFGPFLKCCSFFDHGAILDEFWFGFWEYWHYEKFVLGLYEYVHDVCGKNLLACVNFVLCT